MKNQASSSDCYGRLFPALPERASRVLGAHTTWPPAFPFPARAFRRQDECADTVFYSEPRVDVHHIDEYARAALQEHYLSLIRPRQGRTFINLRFFFCWWNRSSGSDQFFFY